MSTLRMFAVVVVGALAVSKYVSVRLVTPTMSGWVVPPTVRLNVALKSAYRTVNRLPVAEQSTAVAAAGSTIVNAIVVAVGAGLAVIAQACRNSRPISSTATRASCWAATACLACP
jgi:hypothetical protein